MVYLEERVVRDLATDLIQRPSIRWWIFDLASPGLLQFMRSSMGSQLTNAPMVFAPTNGLVFFEVLGWHALQIESFLRAAARWHRLPWLLRPFALLPDANPRHPGNARWAAAIRLVSSH